MTKACYGLVVLGLLSVLMRPAAAEVSVRIGLPHVSIGINLPLYPELVPIPGYPVYYAPQVSANYFFYDGYYWVYQDDYWYASNWYNGPWWLVEPDYVPLFILRVPIVYYRRPPQYFFGWHSYEPPRWGQHWGRDWEHRHRDWNRWQRDTTPPPAPRPEYQRQYTGQRYPRGGEQQTLHQRYYRYQPRDSRVREHVQPRVERKNAPTDRQDKRNEPAMKRPQTQETPRSPQTPGSGWAGPRSGPAPQQAQQEPRQPSWQEGRQPGIQERQQERDRQHQEVRPREEERKGRDYRNYGRSGWQDRTKYQERREGKGQR